MNHGMRGASILLVDDEAEFASTLAERLHLRGFSASVALDGEAALAILAEKGPDSFDLMLLDVMLPGMDGIEVLRRIREAGSRLPVILLTGRSGAKEGIEGMKQGAAGYLTKPVDLQELLDLFAEIGGRGGSHA